MSFTAAGQQTLGQSIGNRRAGRTHADMARSDFASSHAVIIAEVLCRPCCAADFAGGKSGVLELDRAVSRPSISDDDGVIAVAEHAQVTARVDQSAAATGGTQRDERA